jgi:hypothetical protein
MVWGHSTQQHQTSASSLYIIIISTMQQKIKNPEVFFKYSAHSLEII